MFDIFNTKKRKLQQQEQNEKLKKTEDNLDKTIAMGERAVDLQEDFNIKVENFNQEVKEFQKKVDENQKLQSQLQEKELFLNEREQYLNKSKNDLDERIEANRKEEITLHIRSEEIKKDEMRLNKKDRDLDDERENIKNERENIKEREKKSKNAEEKAEKSKEKYDEKYKEAESSKKEYEDKIKDLETREKECKINEADIKKRWEDLKTKESNFATQEETLRKEFEEKQSKWEEERVEIEAKLNEKIKEYDRKMADIDAMGETLDNINFDDSEDGRKAKIVVKETIRVGIGTLEDTLQKFKELDEKYASGTFKGFSVPIDEISQTNEELKTQYEGIKNHAESLEDMDNLFDTWIEKIETCIAEADKNYKSHYFAESYRKSVEGLAYCQGYINMVNIFNDFSGNSQSDDSQTDDVEWFDYYEFFFEEEFEKYDNVINITIDIIKRQWKKMAKKYHPDRNSGNKEAEEKFKKLNEIWEILQDENKKAQYDKTYYENKEKFKQKN